MLIAIEGIDGSGKGTQSKLLVEKLYKNDNFVELFSFPCYSTTFFGKEVGKYLNGDYGQLSEVPIKFATLLYAGDRLENKPKLNSLLSNGYIVVCDRYVASNQAHQASKIHEDKQHEILNWISNLEYNVYEMPKPDMTIFLDISLENSTKFVLQKKQRDYTEKKLDLHEAASNYLSGVQKVYKKLAKENNWITIPVEKNNEIRSIDEISDEIYENVLTFLS